MPASSPSPTPAAELARLGARTLSTLALLAWVALTIVPVMDSGPDSAVRLMVTSLGSARLDLSAVSPPMVLLFGVIAALALSSWVLRRLRVWSLLAMLTGTLLAVLLVAILAYPPSATWDGTDALGNPIGGFEVAGPALGALLWVLGAGALFAAGICGAASCITDRRQRR